MLDEIAPDVVVDGTSEHLETAADVEHRAAGSGVIERGDGLSLPEPIHSSTVDLLPDRTVRSAPANPADEVVIESLLTKVR